uniref:Glycosyltransferase 2-like domain-containing protein n=1 Tax=Plectus sambesii TaxID=2011161 RepID=A0A914X4P4_9BILA
MRISRYLGRRCVRILQYSAVAGALFLFLPLLWRSSSGGDEKVHSAKVIPDKVIPDMPGAYVAEDSKKENVVAVDAGPVDYKKNDNIGGAPVGEIAKAEEAKSAKYRKLPKKDWHDYPAMEADKERKGKGEQGTPVALPSDPETQKLQDQMYRVNGFDALASDQIAVDRSVKDVRHPECRKMKYIEKLPTVTVIFPFHNEHNSTLLRSVYSVINRSPPDVLREVILVDDASTKDFLKAPLEEFLKKAGLADRVKVVRTKKREGLIRARQIGAQHATSEIMVFLDAHSEANYNWLPPLIEPIALDYRYSYYSY